MSFTAWSFRFLTTTVLLNGTQFAWAIDDNWSGNWLGTCSGSRSFEVSLRIGDTKAAQFDWVLTYQGQPSRNYSMFRSESPRVFKLNENNGIIITNFMFDNCLINQFTGQGTRIDTRSCLVSKNTLTFEVVSSSVKPFSESGGVGTFVVQDFEVFDRYLCRLTK